MGPHGGITAQDGCGSLKLLLLPIPKHRSREERSNFIPLSFLQPINLHGCSSARIPQHQGMICLGAGRDSRNGEEHRKTPCALYAQMVRYSAPSLTSQGVVLNKIGYSVTNSFYSCCLEPPVHLSLCHPVLFL